MLLNKSPPRTWPAHWEVDGGGWSRKKMPKKEEAEKRENNTSPVDDESGYHGWGDVKEEGGWPVTNKKEAKGATKMMTAAATGWADESTAAPFSSADQSWMADQKEVQKPVLVISGLLYAGISMEKLSAVVNIMANGPLHCYYGEHVLDASMDGDCAFFKLDTQINAEHAKHQLDGFRIGGKNINATILPSKFVDKVVHVGEWTTEATEQEEMAVGWGKGGNTAAGTGWKSDGGFAGVWSDAAWPDNSGGVGLANTTAGSAGLDRGWGNGRGKDGNASDASSEGEKE